MNDRRATRPATAASILLAGLTIIALLVALKLRADGSVSVDASFQLLFNLAFISLGAITVWRRPDNRMSWLFAWVGIVLGLSMLTDEYGSLRFAGPRPPLGTVAAWLSSWLWVPAFGPLLTLLLLWFPSGQVPSPRWKPVERAAFVLIGALPVLLAFAQDPESEGVNPLAVPWMTRILEAFFVILAPIFPLLVALCAASLVVRFRNSRGEQRQQLKWFVFVAILLPIYMVVDTAWAMFGESDPSWLSVLELTAFLSLPIATGIAILKYRLYDIDLVINRTLVYGALTAILASCYVGLVFGLQTALAPFTAESDLAIAGSTLAVAALFRPIRAHVQGFIDKRFYRRKFDAQRTLEQFSEHLRDEVDLSALSSRLTGVVGDTMQPVHVSLWLRRPETSS